MKYSIRTLLLVVLAVAVCITTYREWEYRSRWGGIKTQMIEWEANLQRPDGKVETFNFSTYDDTIKGAPQYSLMTAEPKWADNGARYFPIRTAEAKSKTRSLIYVLPPGVWVDSVDNAVKELNKLEYLCTQLDAHGPYEPWSGLESERDAPTSNYVRDLFRKAVATPSEQSAN